MNKTIKRLINNDFRKDYILPFLWLRGEEEKFLHEYVGIIENAGMKAFCVESRPHPDFLGEKWWHDLDVLIDEAKKRDMRIWILDDSHFPTGYANGALHGQPLELYRQSIVRSVIPCESGIHCKIPLADKKNAPDWKPNANEAFVAQTNRYPVFDDDKLIAAILLREGGVSAADEIDLSEQIKDGVLQFDTPSEGSWNLNLCYLTRNRGPHRDYINMTSARSCKVLIDTVYEAHFSHYGKYFGNVIAGFFSDEPELGNGHLYEYGKRTPEYEDQAWGSELEAVLRKKWGENFNRYLPILWEENFADDIKAKVRFDYMDALSHLVQESFSSQIGDWCRAHGVEYIGHLIEDNNQHTRSGSSLAHFFRGESGQGFAGIDDIGGQVFPRGEWIGSYGMSNEERNGLFYHYVLGKLASSAAAIDTKKNGRAMCEIFGNYGWEEGVRLEKYLLDHFLVRGINRFVPHAFSMAPFPDGNCPPHFYAHGNNPQYRHFGALMQYANRMCELLNGDNDVPVAILYHAESEWMGSYTPPENIAQPLAEAQIDYEFIPADIFASGEYKAGKGLQVGNRNYRAFLIPAADYITLQTWQAAKALQQNGCFVCYLDRLPCGLYDGERIMPLPAGKECVIPTADLVTALKSQGIETASVSPADKYIRCLHHRSGIYLFVNEGEKVWRGEITLREQKNCYRYDAWNNRLETLQYRHSNGNTVINASLEPLQSYIIVFEDNLPDCLNAPFPETSVRWNEGWTRSICTSLEYPKFHSAEKVALPDETLVEKHPDFSGLIRYEKKMEKSEAGYLEITDAYEGVEVFVNGVSLGIQVAPPFRYKLLPYLKDGENTIRIEVATTLERAFASLSDSARDYSGLDKKILTTPSGINGKIKIK